MKFTLCVAGKTKFEFVQAGVEYYLSQIRKFSDFEIVELKDYPNDEAKDAKTLWEWIETIDAKLIGKRQFFLWDVEGEQVSSEELASKFSSWSIQGYQNVVMLVGGAYGFPKAIKSKVSQRISLSRLTFPHDMVRILICEQIYRSIQIQRKSKYHH